ncbi:MAG TPA: FtsW/RodA/SpoVE family cell cycle protein, partial [Clostridia bacterium]|nr:FtsW/RodA/SpoVE family cell cycle protein [Clostridia bacterium]
MRNADAGKKEATKAKKHVDGYIILATVALVLFGIIMVYSASFYTNQLKDESPIVTLVKQMVGAGLGFLAMFITSKINYRLYSRPVVVYSLVAVACLLLGLVLTPLGIEVNAARRWFKIPVINQNFQPSEVAKFALVVFSAYIMTKNRWWFSSFTKGWLPVIAAIGIFAGLIVIEPNLSTAICICLIGLTMIVLGGGQGLYTMLLAAAGFAGGVALMFSAQYRRSRYLAFLDPFKYKDNESYQLVQSLYALGDGGLFGVGLGKSRQKLGNLPFC